MKNVLPEMYTVAWKLRFLVLELRIALAAVEPCRRR